MKNLRGRTWNNRDIQAEASLSWCRYCGRELYWGMRQDGVCDLCREQERRQEK